MRISNRTHTVQRALQWDASAVNWSIWSLSESWMKRAGSGGPLRRADSSALGLPGRFRVTELVPNYTWAERAAAPLAHLRLRQPNLRSDLRRVNGPTWAPLSSPLLTWLLSCTQLSECLWVYLAALILDWVWLFFLLFPRINDVWCYFYARRRSSSGQK